MSLMFLLVALPVVTWGCACALLAIYAEKQASGKKFKCWPECRTFFSTRTALFGLLFGLVDIIFVLAFVLSLTSLFARDATILSRLLSCVFLWIDALYLLSGIYRYPLLTANRELSFVAVLSKSILLTVSNAPNVVLIFMAGLCVAMVSFCAGILLFAFLPGALALLHRYNYQAKFSGDVGELGEQKELWD